MDVHRFPHDDVPLRRSASSITSKLRGDEAMAAAEGALSATLDAVATRATTSVVGGAAADSGAESGSGSVAGQASGAEGGAGGGPPEMEAALRREAADAGRYALVDSLLMLPKDLLRDVHTQALGAHEACERLDDASSLASRGFVVVSGLVDEATRSVLLAHKETLPVDKVENWGRAYSPGMSIGEVRKIAPRLPQPLRSKPPLP